MAVPSHPLITDYMARHGIPDGVRADGRLTVRIDDKYRVHLLGARNGWLALSARLCSPAAGQPGTRTFLYRDRPAGRRDAERPSLGVRGGPG